MPIGVGNPVVLGPRPKRFSTVSFGGGGKSPDQVTGLWAWWDFSDITTLFQDLTRTVPVTADGDAVLGVADKSGGGRHLDRDAGAVEPLYKANIYNGKSVLRLSIAGFGQLGTTAAQTQAQPLTYLAVYALRTAMSSHAGNIETLGAANDVPQLGLLKASNEYSHYAGASVPTGIAPTLGTPQYIVGVWNSTSSLVRINGVETTGDAGTQGYSTDTIRLGQQAQDADWGELAIFSTSVVPADILALESYARAKWGIA